MIFLILALAVIACAFAVLSVAQLALVVYLVRKRKQAVAEYHNLFRNYYGLLVEKSAWIASEQQKPSLLWYDKGDRVMH